MFRRFSESLLVTRADQLKRPDITGKEVLSNVRPPSRHALRELQLWDGDESLQLVFEDQEHHCSERGGI